MTDSVAPIVRPLEFGSSGIAKPLDGALTYLLFSKNPTDWSVSLSYGVASKVLFFAKSEEEAIAKANEDYRQRILSSLNMEAFDRMVESIKDLEADLPRIQRSLLAIDARDKTVRRSIRALQQDAQQQGLVSYELALKQLLSLMKIDL